MNQAFIGTSGFMYPHWRGHFYPPKLPQKDWFRYYTKEFDTVELNVSFYRLPKKETFKKWRKTAGKNFVFSIKGSRYITHIKRLKDPQEAIGRFFGAADGLRSAEVGRKDVILWQLPPRMKANLERLESFLKLLPRDWRYAFEFRHETWLNQEIYKFLKEFKAAIVFQDYPEWPMTEEITAEFIYLRFHGAKALYSSNYSDKELKEWGRKIRKWMGRGLDVYAYFNNDALGYAVENARTLKKFIGR